MITGVADRVPERIAQLVYVDTGPLPDGLSQHEFSPPRAGPASDAALVAEGAHSRAPL